MSMDDLISRAEVLDYLQMMPIDLGYSEVERIEDFVKHLPSAQRTGKWIYGNDFHWYTASCNECGYQRRTDIKADRWNQWKYCPNCGARMVEDE